MHEPTPEPTMSDSASVNVPFFLVWRGSNSRNHPFDTTPTTRHPVKAAAIAEAQRLAAKNPGVRFYVVTSLAHVEAPVLEPKVVEHNPTTWTCTPSQSDRWYMPPGGAKWIPEHPISPATLAQARTCGVDLNVPPTASSEGPQG